jgi:2-methylcitrate dehydratase PrpD
MDCMEITEGKEFNRSFPEKRFARVCIDTDDEMTYDSGQIEARWDAGAPPSDEELLVKFCNLAKEQLAEDRVKRLETAILGCEDLADVTPLLILAAEPPGIRFRPVI